MTRTVNGERLFESREKEILRKMIRQVADFSGVEVLTYCIMSNHFHVLIRVPSERLELGRHCGDSGVA
jgi:REP element-mobilizing transposase RayT